MIPPMALLAAAEQALGGSLTATWMSGPFSEAEVWALRRDPEAPPIAWLKRHRHRGKLDAEARAHTEWLPAAGQPGAWIARLDDTTCLLAHVAGRPLSDPGLGDEQRRRGWRSLGAALRALHAVPYPDTDPLPLAEAWRAREQSWLTRASPALTSAQIEACRARFAAPRPPARRVPCHRDVRPENVLITPGGEARLLDFGQSRMDDAVSDWVKLLAPPSAPPEACRAAFELGYGRRADEIGALSRALLLHGLATLAWAHRKGDLASVEEGRLIISNCLS